MRHWIDPPGGYELRPGVAMTKTSGPATAADEIPAIAAVLLAHDQHVDNLDVAGRAFLEQTPLALTTQAGARRLGDPAQGLAPWQSLELPHPDGRGRAASLGFVPTM